MGLFWLILILLIMFVVIKSLHESSGSSNKYESNTEDTEIDKLSKNEMRYRQYKGKGRPEYGARWSAYQDGKKSKKR